MGRLAAVVIALTAATSPLIAQEPLPTLSRVGWRSSPSRTVTLPDRVTTFAFRLPYVVVLAERQEGEAEGSYGLDLYRVR